MGGGIPENVAVDVREAVRLQSRPPSVPIGFVPQKSHSQAGLATPEQNWWAEILQMLMSNQVRDREVLVLQGWSSMQLPLP